MKPIINSSSWLLIGLTEEKKMDRENGDVLFDSRAFLVWLMFVVVETAEIQLLIPARRRRSRCSFGIIDCSDEKNNSRILSLLYVEYGFIDFPIYRKPSWLYCGKTNGANFFVPCLSWSEDDMRQITYAWCALWTDGHPNFLDASGKTSTSFNNSSMRDHPNGNSPPFSTTYRWAGLLTAAFLWLVSSPEAIPPFMFGIVVFLTLPFFTSPLSCFYYRLRADEPLTPMNTAVGWQRNQPLV